MMTIRRADERGHLDHGWLNTWHTFSFADYMDPRWMGFRSLRVINEDYVAPSRGFGTHPHRDMEIVTYVLEGGLAHKDSMGNGSIIRPGEVQRMTAGTGVTHSEVNPSREEKVHLLQIWILPERRGLTPGYEQKSFPAEEKRGQLRLVASREGSEGSVTVHQDVRIYAGLVTGGEQVEYTLAEGRHAWVQVARGTVQVNGEVLNPGDGAALSDVEQLVLRDGEDAEILVFDMA